jgi:hypothetical protein
MEGFMDKSRVTMGTSTALKTIIVEGVVIVPSEKTSPSR